LKRGQEEVYNNKGDHKTTNQEQQANSQQL
jgi:hypothetical protein